MTLFSNWTILDLVRSVADRSAKGGVVGLGGETERPLPSFSSAMDPLTRLVDGLAEHGADLLDYREVPRTGRGAAHGTRPIGRVTATMWHQAAAVLGRPARYLGVPCHAAVMRDGDVALLHPLTAVVWHGHSANGFSVGVEIDCRAAGVEGDRRTFWRSRSEKVKGKQYEDLVQEATDKQLTSAFLLGIYITEEVERLGGVMKAQMFHRNSHSSRTSDPGSRIALGVAAPLAARFHQEYGGPVVGSGSKTPETWMPRPSAGMETTT